MSNNPIPVVKFLFREDYKALNEALRLSPGTQVQELQGANDLATLLSSIPAGLVIASLKNKDDLVQIASYMKLGKKAAKDCAVKVVVINFSGDRNYEKAIAKLGILDQVEPSINTKALKFKLDFWMKSLTAQAKLSSNQNTQKVVKTTDQNKSANAEKKIENTAPVWTPPLDLEDDIWLIKDADVKKILGKWLIRILGPSPYVGQWAELKPGLWRYDIKEFDREMFTPNEGAWYYSGEQKPDFVWKENNWLITGENFELFFKNSKEILSRFKSKDKALTICKNSTYAKTKESIIIESFNKELVFKKEAENLENLEGEGSTDKMPGNLSGKNKTEQIEQDNLKGKSKSDQSEPGNLQGKNKTEKLEQGNLEGKTKTSADKSGNLKGDIENQDIINNDELNQKANNKKEKTFWDGKNAYDKEGKADFGLKPEENRPSSPNLEAPADNEHQKHYKNHNDAKNVDGQPEDMKGKSSTDEIPTHYGSKKKGEKPGIENKPDEMSGKTETDKLKTHYGQRDPQGHESEEDKPSDMSGKSSTDKLPGHYSNAKEGQETEAKSKNRSEYDANGNIKPAAERNSKESAERETKEKTEREQKTKGERETNAKGDVEGKSSKDNLEKQNPNSKEAKERQGYQEEEKDGMSGKSSTDKIAGHYSNQNKSRSENAETEGSDRDSFSKEKSSKKREESDQATRDMYAREKKVRPEDDDFEERDQNDKNRGRKNKSAADKFDSSVSEKLSKEAASENYDDLEGPRSSRKAAAEAGRANSESDTKKSGSKNFSDEFNTGDSDEFSGDKNQYNVDDLLAREKSDKPSHGSNKGADILPLDKSRQEKAKAANKIALNETGLDELTRDSKVISFLIYKNQKIQCELNDFFDDTIIFLTKAQSLEISSQVNLDLAFKFLERDKKLAMEGKILTVDEDGEGNNFVTVQLSKENTASFDVFMRLYETRQSNINEFIKKVKGL